MDINQKAISKIISKILLIIISLSLVILAILLTIFLMKKTWFLGHLLLSSETIDINKFTENIIAWFLFFEFLALIAKYFKSRFHFPLRYFIYIGITAIVRLIVVNHTDSADTFWYSGSILILLLALYLANMPVLRRDNA